jgi:hypothetical protein
VGWWWAAWQHMNFTNLSKGENMLKLALMVTALTMLLSCQQNTPLTDYEPKSNQEQALKSVLLEFQEAVIDKDSKKIENLIHEKASIMIGRDRTMLTKAEYAKILPERLAENSSIFLGTPKMTVSGDKAEIKIYMSRGGGNFLMVFNMTMNNDKWYIASWEF